MGKQPVFCLDLASRHGDPLRLGDAESYSPTIGACLGVLAEADVPAWEHGEGDLAGRCARTEYAGGG